MNGCVSGCVCVSVLICLSRLASVSSNPSGSQEIHSLPSGVSATLQRACHTQSGTRSKTASAKKDENMEESGE